MIEVAAKVEAIALRGIPVVQAGDDLAALIARALAQVELALRDGDVIAIASKVVSRAEGRFVEVAAIEPSARARELAATTGKDPRHVEIILRESAEVSRAARGVLITRHRLGHVVANAGVDFSNVAGDDDHAILWPRDPDASAARLRGALAGRGEAPVAIGVVITDSFGRPFRIGTVGVAIGVAGLPVLDDHRGRRDLFGRPLERTITAPADQVAAIADLVAGQANEGRGVVLVRGIRFESKDERAADVCRPTDEDLYA